MDGHDCIHCLHHEKFGVNDGDGLIALDKWFGTFRDGSPEAEAGMLARFELKKAPMTAKAGKA